MFLSAFFALSIESRRASLYRRRGDRRHPPLLSIALRLFAAILSKRDRALFLIASRHGSLSVV